MVIRTVLLSFAAKSKLTGVFFVVKRMIFTLFPAMTFLAGCIVLAPIQIIHNEVSALPILARNWIVWEDVRFSSIVLPIMSINALGFVVFG